MHNKNIDQKKINQLTFCFSASFPSVQEGIFALFGISKSQLKKYHLPVKFLRKMVMKGDEVSLPIDLVNFLHINPVYKGKCPKIIYEDENILGISKPEKVHTHPLRYDENDNLLSFMREIGRSEELKINENKYDRGLLYRLDFETSGLILYAKNEVTYHRIRNDFSMLVKHKTYLAIVEGAADLNGKFTHYLKPKGIHNSRVEVCEAEVEGSKKADCEVKTIAYNDKEDISLVKVTLQQGLRHQIRKQLEALGHPVWGDPLYAKRNIRDRLRMFLHCYQYDIQLGTLVTIQDKNWDLFSDFFSIDGSL